MTGLANWRAILDPVEDGGAASWPARLFLLLGITLSVCSAGALTLPDLPSDWAMTWRDAGALAGAMFLVEYVWRWWRAPCLAPLDKHSRRHYLLSPLGLADLICIAPMILISSPRLASIVLLPQLLTLLKLARLTPALSLVAAVVRSEARALLAGFLVLIVLLVLASGVMYLLERDVQPVIFSSLPKSLWWGIVTMATVGYGDMTPVTVLGRIFGGFVMLLGIAMFAVPTGILATGFATEFRRRDFVVTWQAVAKVPLFAGLDASHISEISRLLRAQTVPARQTIVRFGEAADAMFIIMQGEVEVEISPQPVRLGKGQIFGEIGLIHDVSRTATVTSVTECRLLSLEANDFRRLMNRYSSLRDKVMAVAEARVASSLSAATPAPTAPDPTIGTPPADKA
jgi:voltage-gated potassium channel